LCASDTTSWDGALDVGDGAAPPVAAAAPGGGRTRLIAIAGPTASGKSALALGVAERIGGEIVSADSMQVYRGLDIGTAKPSPEEMSSIPHHLVDVVDPHESFSVAAFQALARQAVAGIAARGRMPVVVGGTGLYLRAALHDYDFSAPGQDAGLRRQLRGQVAEAPDGLARLHAELALIDPVAAARINPRDERRIIRALEVWRLTGRRISESWGQPSPAYDALVVGLRIPRDLLYRRIDRRVDAMIEAGLVDEVRALVNRGYTRALVSGQALGYKEIVDYLLGRVSLPEAVSQIKQATRRYAKRQLSWFRTEPGLIWVDGPGERGGPAVEAVLGLARDKWGQCC
jgi:tRNA dimethylallyltransferase